MQPSRHTVSVSRLHHSGKMVTDDGLRLWAQITRQQAQELGIESGQHVWLSLQEKRMFEGSAAGQAAS